MFNILISADPEAWETDQLMRMKFDRFKEHSPGVEAQAIDAAKPATLKTLEQVPALLAYESFRKGSRAGVVRYGYLRNITVAGDELAFRFLEEGRLTRSVIRKYEDHLGMTQWEMNRTHWAVKDGDIPTALLKKLTRSYDIVFSFAGEDRAFVEEAATYLKGQGVRLFYDRHEEADLWGKNLAEHFDVIYRRSAKYCVVFISAAYKRKMWTRHERRSALSRAILEQDEYILPARFDATDIDGIPPATAYIDLSTKSPTEFARLILRKLGRSAK